MDFKMEMRTDAHLFSIKTLLVRKHGKIADLVICRDAYQEQNELTDDMKTLKEYGFEGGSSKENPPIHNLYYNFKIGDASDPDPLLLCD